MVYFVKACVFIASALSAINSSAAVRMPPRTFHESTVSEEEARVVSESTHKALYSLLSEETRRLQSANANQNAILNVKMTKEEKAHIRDYNKNNGSAGGHGFKPALVGVSQQVDKFVGRKNPTRRLGQNNSNPEPFEDGVLELTSEGFTWSIVVNSEDAEGISVLLSDLSIPAGVKISAFNEHGAFDTDIQDRVEDGQVWTKTIPGYEAFLVFHYAGDAPQEAIDNLRFSIEKVGIYNPNPVDDDARGRKLGDCNWGPAECVVDYQCCDPTSIDDNSCGKQDLIFRDTHLTDLSNSHAKMKWWSGNWGYSCSAGLINNASGRSLLLTANHCLKNANRSLELFFRAKNNQCESNTNCLYNFRTADTIGMKTLASSATTDFTLFEPNQPLPAGKTYFALGWNTDPVSIGETLYRVHHPLQVLNRTWSRQYTRLPLKIITCIPNQPLEKPWVAVVVLL